VPRRIKIEEKRIIKILILVFIIIDLDSFHLPIC